MTTHRERWRQAQRRAMEHRPWFRLDRVEVTQRKDAAGYEVVIEGVNLWGAISPPRVTVGGETLEQLTFAFDGRSLRGVLPRRPSRTNVVVDYGFARAELTG